MNLSTFLEHWKLSENPYRAEEARQDPVFTRLEEAAGNSDEGKGRPMSDVGCRMSDSGPTPSHIPHPTSPITTSLRHSVTSPTAHSEFEKIAGEFDRPSTAIVFGEKGSGKTAIRLQLADRIAAYNRAREAAARGRPTSASAPASGRCFLIAYDDLNPVLGRFVERVGNERKVTLTETLAKFRLVDHIDAIVASVVPQIVDAVLAPPAPSPSAKPGESQARPDLGDDPRRAARKWDKPLRTDLLVLQSVYDRPSGAVASGAAPMGPERTDGKSAAGGGGGGAGVAERRTRRLRGVLRLRLPISYLVWTLLAFVGWAPAAVVAYYAYTRKQIMLEPSPLTNLNDLLLNRTVWLIAGLLLLYFMVLAKRSLWDRVRAIAAGHRVRRQVRTSTRSDASLARSLRQLDPALVDPSVLPMTPSDDVRYAMLERLRRVLGAFGFTTAIVIIDRVDEPTLVSGDPDRMKAVVWPLLNNKFLQQPWLGVKMLLPMELRHALFRETAVFFQEARLDKQNLIERLSWTGQMLYDLCNARLDSCRRAGEPPIALLDLFAEDVTRQDLIESLDQMHQPRDAFKLLYQCFIDHCASQTSDQPSYRVPRLILDMVRKAQVERVRQLYRGVRPA